MSGLLQVIRGAPHSMTSSTPDSSLTPAPAQGCMPYVERILSNSALDAIWLGLSPNIHTQ